MTSWAQAAGQSSVVSPPVWQAAPCEGQHGTVGRGLRDIDAAPAAAVSAAKIFSTAQHQGFASVSQHLGQVGPSEAPHGKSAIVLACGLWAK